MPGKVLLLSSTYIFIPKPNCLRLLIQEAWAALFLLAARDGSSNAARMPMIAITTSNSIKVKAEAIVQYLLTFLFMPRTMIAFLEGQLSFYTCPPDNARAFSKALCETLVFPRRRSAMKTNLLARSRLIPDATPLPNLLLQYNCLLIFYPGCN